jgi:hypothetical protein
MAEGPLPLASATMVSVAVAFVSPILPSIALL